MVKDSKTALVPKLRFLEFQSAPGWQTVPLEKVAERVSTKNSDGEVTRVLTNSAEYGVLDQRDYFDRDIATAGKVDGYYIVDAGDYVYNPRTSVTAPVGPISRNNIGKGVMSPLYTVFRFSTSKTDFYEHFFKSTGWHSYVRSAASTGARHDRMSITTGAFMQMPVPTPDGTEQQKIADCLSSLDELIAAQGRKVEALKTYKRGLMQQLFPREGETLPRLRFPEFRDAPEWESTTIQDLIDRKFIVGHLDGNHGELYPRADEFSTTGIPYITANDFRIGRVEFDTCKRLPLDRALKFKKGVARDGDILFAHNATVGPVAKLVTTYDFVILSTTATYFRCDHKQLLNDFLLFALASPLFVAQYTRVMSQSTRDQVPITTQRKLFLQIPNLPEQQRIADCLSALDGLVAAEFARLNELKAHKNGLMQQLFPSLEEA